MDPELADTEPLLLGKNRVGFLGAPGHNTLAEGSVHTLVLCVLLLTEYIELVTDSIELLA